MINKINQKITSILTIAVIAVILLTPTNIYATHVAPEFSFKFGSTGSGNGQFNGIYLMEYDSNLERLYVIDDRGDRVQVFDPQGNFITSISVLGSSWLMGIAIDYTNNRIYVGDFSQHKISMYDYEDVSGVITYSDAGIFAYVNTVENGNINDLVGLAVHPITSDVYVVGDNQIHIFDSDGNYKNAISEYGFDLDQLAYPIDVILDIENDKLYISERSGNRVSVYGLTDETWKRTIGEQGTCDGEFNYAYGMALDNNTGLWYVSDLLNNRVIVFQGATGEFVYDFGSAGTGDGEFNYPLGLELGSDSLLYVGGNSNDRVQAFVLDDSHYYCGQLESYYDNIIIGTDSAEILTGTSQNDLILGYGDDDYIRGGYGHDCIYGGDGNDFINANAGHDTIYGGSGNDNILGHRGNDVIYGEMVMTSF